MRIGKNIKSIRQAKGVTQDVMAEALFVTRQTVSNYENGRSRPDLEMLIKIAQVLDTDVNTILYGPIISQSKKNSYKWLFISGGILAVVTALYVILEHLFPGFQTVYGYQYALRMIVQLTVLPAMMFTLGWVLTHCLSIFGNLQQLRPEKTKVLRVISLIVMGVVAVIPIPHIIFFGIAGYRSYVHHSVSMSFPYIPIYQEVFRAMLFIIFHLPFVYSILGSIFWLFGLPSIKKREGDMPKASK